MQIAQRLQLSSKQLFAAVSVLLVAAVALATSFSQAMFFRQAIIERESRIIDDVVDALAIGGPPIQLSQTGFLDPRSQVELEGRFRPLKNLPGVELIKVFNRNHSIVWSNDSSLIGTQRTSHPTDLQRALEGEIRTKFSHLEQIIYAVLHLPETEPLIEFYVPFSWTAAQPTIGNVDGAVALYRSPKELNRTIFHGLLWLWLVTAVGGTVLVLTVYTLFKSAYSRQRAVELEFARFTKEQDRIIQVEKLSAIGQMVTEIAHQLNNPLVGVVNLAGLAEREIDKPERVRALLREVQSAGKMCRDFVQRMLDLNAAARSQPKPTDMVQLIRETVAFFRQSFGKGPQVELELPGEPIVINIDPVLLRHALFNLLHNAAQADPSGTTTVSLTKTERGGVAGCEVAVSDCGEGISAAAADKLFVPFFTTRSGGTGLGLPVAQQIVLKHGGLLQAANRTGGGAIFTMWLPFRDETRSLGNKPITAP